MSFKYPEARRDGSVKEDYFGVQVLQSHKYKKIIITTHFSQISDPYRWLEDPDSSETQEFAQAENKITRPYLDGCTYKNKIKDKITQLWNYPKFSIPSRHGNKYYQYRNSGKNIIYNYFYAAWKSEWLFSERIFFTLPLLSSIK